MIHVHVVQIVCSEGKRWHWLDLCTAARVTPVSRRKLTGDVQLFPCQMMHTTIGKNWKHTLRDFIDFCVSASGAFLPTPKFAVICSNEYVKHKEQNCKHSFLLTSACLYKTKKGYKGGPDWIFSLVFWEKSFYLWIRKI